MFVFAFEGALLAFIVNGDRFVLLALLPRRKPRTDRSVQPPCHSLFKELNLTTGGYYPSRVPKADGMDFCFGSGTAPARERSPYGPRSFRFRAVCDRWFSSSRSRAPLFSAVATLP